MVCGVYVGYVMWCGVWCGREGMLCDVYVGYVMWCGVWCGREGLVGMVWCVVCM